MSAEQRATLLEELRELLAREFEQRRALEGIATRMGGKVASDTAPSLLELQAANIARRWIALLERK